jgi:hypothetical protein
MLYYLYKNLQYGSHVIGKGCVHSLARLPKKNRDILTRKGIISVFNVPPMDQLPGWQLRAPRFAEHGIDIHKFFAMPDDEIAAVIGSRPHVIAKWRKELRELLGLNRAKVQHG